jgi:chromosome segregation ATPase
MTSYEKKNLIKFDDNIPVPNYFIEIINSLILQVKMGETEQCTTKNFDNGIYKHIYKEYWEMVIDTIVRIKTSLKETTKNPNDYFGFKQQLNSYIVKSNLQQERILELENKIKNIQSICNDAVIDNNKKENINKDLTTKIIELENKLNEEINKTKNIWISKENQKQDQKKIEELKKERLVYRQEYKLQKKDILELNEKIENIQMVYFDTLNDNKKIEKINKDLRTKITELENKFNEEKDKTNNTPNSLGNNLENTAKKESVVKFASQMVSGSDSSRQTIIRNIRNSLFEPRSEKENISIEYEEIKSTKK